MNENRYDDSVNYILNVMNEDEKIRFEAALKSFNKEERDEFNALTLTFSSLALSNEIVSAPSKIKNRLFNEINQKQTPVVKLKSRINYIAIAASIVLTFFVTRYFFSSNPIPLSDSSESIFLNTSNTHDAEREKLNSALCLAAQGDNMTYKSQDGETYYGKSYFNKFSKSAVIHICFLPKNDGKVYTLWLKKENGQYEKLKIFEAKRNIQEINYLVNKEFLDDSYKMMVTLENESDSNFPSHNIVLAKL